MIKRWKEGSYAPPCEKPLLTSLF